MEEIRLDRSHKQFILDTFNMDYHNDFDKSTQDSLNQLKNKFNQNQNEYIRLKEQIESDNFEEIVVDENGIPYSNDPSIFLYDLQRSIGFIDDQLTALYEAKIIYSFKSLEIKIKSLLNIAYSDKLITKNHKWEGLIQFLKIKDIDITTIEGYKEVNELRSVNNNIKHNDTLTDSFLKGIKEFKGQKNFNYYNLDLFYLRVKDSPMIFLNALKSEIYKELYDFNNTKISNIAQSLALRMEKKDAEKLIKAINECY